MQEIGIVGWGKTASYFADRIEKSNSSELIFIATRKAINQAHRFNNISVDEIPLNFKGVLLLCISDDAIALVAEKFINHKQMLVAHCAGSVSIEVLSKCNNYGVFYPLQTLAKKDEQSFATCIEANNEQNVTLLKKLAENLGCAPVLMNSEQRLILHLAATASNNFVHYLFTNIAQFLENNNMDMELLKPLIYKTIEQIVDSNSNLAALQTGPANRGDKKTIEKHRNLLKSDVEMDSLYSFFTEAIANNKTAK